MTEQGIRDFIAQNRWIFARTYAKFLPHEYCLRENATEKFDDFVVAIRENGVKAKFFSKYYIYLEVDGYFYWTMGNPIEETTLINRASKDNYELLEIKGQLYMFKKQKET